MEALFFRFFEEAVQQGRFFVGHRGPHAIVIAWGEAEQSPRLSRHAGVAARLSGFRDDDDSQEPSLWDAGFPVMHIAAFPCLFCGAQPTRAAVGGGPYGKL